jgi:signal transduction histidine kinase
MRRRSRAGGKRVKLRRRKTVPLKRRNTPKAVRLRKSSTTGRQTEVARLTRELHEALEKQSATSEVLRVISSSPGELGPVFHAILQNATRICEAKFGVLMLSEGDAFRVVAMHNAPPGYVEYRQREPIVRARPGNPVARVGAKEVVQIADVLGDAAWSRDDPQFAHFTMLTGARSLIAVPMLDDDETVGLINVFHQEVRTFTESQVALLTNFAAQAVIAIENTRLLNELRQSLEQQTATAEVLSVISSSPGELDPVFQSMLENAARVCDAKFGMLFRLEDGAIRSVASLGVPDQLMEFFQNGPRQPSEDAPVMRAARTKQPVHVIDFATEPAYIKRNPLAVASVEHFGVRTLLVVPMLRDGEFIGAFAIFRQEVRPFSDKQIELVKNFAAQAVIAIENTRLLNELRQRTTDLTESLEQQTATSEVLKAISSSPGELQPVFTAMLSNAVRICGAKFGNLFLYEDDSYRAVAVHGPARYADLWRRRPVAFMSDNRGVPLDRLSRTKDVIHVLDLRTEPTYAAGNPRMLNLIDDAGARTMLLVPMFKESELIGAIIIYSQEIRPFTDKQIELIKNFAAQAVIAIENTRLLHELRQRTNDLSVSLEELRTAQDRLVQTEKLASLGQLTAGIAHEIKNPLNFVNNFSSVSVELIDELRETLGGVTADAKTRTEITELTNTLRGNLEKVVQHGKRADAIVKNMLLHSRQGSGEHRPVDVNALVEESLNLAYHGARAEKPGFEITLERSFDPAAGEADLFPQEITRVLLNLISNGFYAATKRKAEANKGDREPALTAATRNLGRSVEIRIRDNGTGIPSEVKEKMFNPFFTTKPAGEGTGLGLSISHDIIVKQHGGSIEVDTKPGEFTEFRIVLPRRGASTVKSGKPG